MNSFNGRRIACLLAAVFVSAIDPAHAAGPSYVLALTWQPAFCESDAGGSRPECRDTSEGDWGEGDWGEGAWSNTHFTLHGLWPNADRNGDGRMDEEDDYCLPPASRAQSIARDKADWGRLPPVPLPDDLRQRLSRVMPGTASKLDRHQWVKHGSCSGLSAARYFAAAVALTEAVAGTEFSKFIAAPDRRNVARRDLLRSFAVEFGPGSDRALQLVCRKDDGVSVLSEIRLRLRVEAVEAPLSATSLDTAKAGKGNCPARFRVEGTE